MPRHQLIRRRLTCEWSAGVAQQSGPRGKETILSRVEGRISASARRLGCFDQIFEQFGTQVKVPLSDRASDQGATTAGGGPYVDERA